MFYSWLSPKLGVRPLPHKGGCGIVAAAPLAKGELLVVWGGRVIPAAELDPTLPDFTRRVLQIEEDLFLFNPLPDDPADCFNHSCEPNAGFCGQVALVALRGYSRRRGGHLRLRHVRWLALRRIRVPLRVAALPWAGERRGLENPRSPAALRRLLLPLPSAPHR